MVVTVATDTADIDAFFAAIESPVTEATAAAVVQHTEQATDMLPVSALPADIVPQVELALYNRAIGTSAWKEQLDRDGVPVKVRYEVPADVAAAKALLAAHAPERYGVGAGAAMPPVYIVTDPVQLRALLAGQEKKLVSVIEHEQTTGASRQDVVAE